jgi:hypothetical protein
MEAEIIIDYEDINMAKAVAEAISPDNCKMPAGLKVETTNSKEKVFTLVECKIFSTFLATIDDLLFSVVAAERTVECLDRC